MGDLPFNHLHVQINFSVANMDCPEGITDSSMNIKRTVGTGIVEALSTKALGAFREMRPSHIKTKYQQHSVWISESHPADQTSMINSVPKRKIHGERQDMQHLFSAATFPCLAHNGQNSKPCRIHLPIIEKVSSVTLPQV